MIVVVFNDYCLLGLGSMVRTVRVRVTLPEARSGGAILLLSFSRGPGVTSRRWVSVTMGCASGASPCWTVRVEEMRLTERGSSSS